MRLCAPPCFFSTGITDNNDRQKYLDLAEECGLDLAQITKRVVENIRNRSDLNITSLKESQIESANTNISEVSRPSYTKILSINLSIFSFLSV